MRNHTRSLVALSLVLGFGLTTLSPRRADAIIGIAVVATGGTAIPLLVGAGVMGAGALASGLGVGVATVAGIGGARRAPDWAQGLIYGGLATLIAGVIVLETSPGVFEFAEVTENNRAEFLSVLSPELLEAYDNEWESIQIVRQQVQHDLEQAYNAGMHDQRQLSHLSAQRWEALATSQISDPLARVAVATIARAVLEQQSPSSR